MISTMRRTAALLAGGALVLGLAACGGNITDTKTSPGASESGDIILGMLTPLSGSSAAVGPTMKNAAQLAVDEINKGGGVLGRQLKLVAEDEGCDPKTAAAGAAKLVSAGVKVSVGGFCSSATLPTLTIFGKQTIPMIIPAANSNDLVKDKLKNVFLINGTGAQQAAAAVKFIKASGVKSVALADDNTSYSKDITTRSAELLKGDGAVSIASQQSVTAGESDYGSAVTQIIRSNAEFVYWTGYYQEGGLIIKQLRAAGYKGKIMVADGSVDKQIVSIAGEANSQGVYATMTQTPQTIPGGEAWTAKYKAAFNADPGPYSPTSYDAVRVAAEAIKKAGSTNGDAIITALENMGDFKVFSGSLKFTPEHTLAEGGFDILVIQGGDFTLNK